MKKTLICSVLAFCIFSLNAQNCESICQQKLFDYEYTVHSNSIDITFTVGLIANSESTISYSMGGKYTEHYKIGTEDTYTHTFSLNDRKNFKDGYFSVDVLVNLETTTNYTNEIVKQCYSDSRKIEIYDGSVTLSAVTERQVYKVNSPIKIKYNVNSMFPRNFNYTLNVNGPSFSEVTTGTIYEFEMNNTNEVFEFTPTKVGSYSIRILIIATQLSYELIIYVGNEETDIVQPIDYTKDTFALYAHVGYGSESLKNAPIFAEGFYSGKKLNNYSLKINGVLLTECNNWEDEGYYNCNFAGTKIKYCRIGQDSLAFGEEYVQRPNVFEKPIYVGIEFCIWGYQDGLNANCYDIAMDDSYKKCLRKKVEVNPITISNELNNIKINAIPDSAQIVNINLYTDACATITMDNLNDEKDELNWVQDLKTTDEISFKPTPNFSGIDRDLEIKVYLDEAYEKCFSTIDGEKMNYRQIKVFQPTAITKSNLVDEQYTSLPNVSTWSKYDATKGDVYYIKLNSGDTNNIKYLKDPYNMPLSVIKYMIEKSKLFLRYVIVEAYNEENEFIGSTAIF